MSTNRHGMPIYLSVAALLSGAILSSCGRSAAEVSGVDGQVHAERIGEAAAALAHQKTLIHNAHDGPEPG
jgi:hypothetical protein